MALESISTMTIIAVLYGMVLVSLAIWLIVRYLSRVGEVLAVHPIRSPSRPDVLAGGLIRTRLNREHLCVLYRGRWMVTDWNGKFLVPVSPFFQDLLHERLLETALSEEQQVPQATEMEVAQ